MNEGVNRKRAQQSTLNCCARSCICRYCVVVYEKRMIKNKPRDFEEAGNFTSAAELHKEKERVFANLSPMTEKTKKGVITTKQKTITFKF